MDMRNILMFVVVLIIGAFLGSMFPQINIIRRVTG